MQRRTQSPSGVHVGVGAFGVGGRGQGCKNRGRKGQRHNHECVSFHGTLPLDGLLTPHETKISAFKMRANAFAAWLLMPDSLVQAAATAENIRLPNVRPQGLAALAKRLNVSLDALSHHMINRGWIKEAIG